MTVQYLIDTYGYAAILIGTFLEGETILVLGGIAAKLGYLKLPWVILCAFVGSLFGDQLLFFLGRYKGPRILVRLPTWQKRTDKVLLLMEKRRMLIILGFRFFYGMRTVTPFVLGMSRVPVTEFVLFNTISAGVWATLFGILGYVFGHGLELVLGDIRRYEIEILGGMVIVGALLWLVRVLRRS